MSSQNNVNRSRPPLALGISKALSFYPNPRGNARAKISPVADRPHVTNIRIFNSLTGSKEPLTLAHENAVIKWVISDAYLMSEIGGPTVYDHAHIGHARNYIQIDVIIRILTKYFGYTVDHVLGMTNIDDKIINKARELNITPEELANRFEEDFYNDLKALNVLPPSRIGRVTEHLQEIVDFIQVILQKGLAYIVNDSVYFDSQKFGSRGDKLNPHTNVENIGYDSGDSEKDQHVKEKRHPKDFALWKKARVGEPGWPNPFSKELGRPGWHIECSAVATKQLGPKIDIHAGGIDLLFPHHNNEICQCDAHFDYQKSGSQWVNYFVHTGHLHIQGRKMSKSLKNFISIKDFLKQNSATAFRVFCLSVPYNTDVDFSNDRIKDAQNILARFTQFFSNIDIALRYIAECNASAAIGGYERKWIDVDLRFSQTMFASKLIFRRSLKDNFDTVAALRILNEFIIETAQYISPASLRKSKVSRNPDWPKDSLEHIEVAKPSLPLPSLLEEASKFVSSSLDLFGVEISKNTVKAAPSPKSSSVNQDEVLAKAVNSLASLRQLVRSEVRKGEVDKKKILSELDTIRGSVIPSLGFTLKDAADGSYIIEKKVDS